MQLLMLHCLPIAIEVSKVLCGNPDQLPSVLTINCNISMATTTETVRPWQQLGCIMQPIAAAKKKRESQRNAARTAF